MRNAYFSAGEACATAFQIRRCTNNEAAYFFDWLITPGESYGFIAKSNDGFLDPGNWEIVDDGLRLLDKYSGLKFQHEFKNVDDKPGNIDPNQVERHLPTARSKFLYLKNKLIIALKTQPRSVVIRAERGITSPEAAMERLVRLKRVFLPINPDLKFIIASAELSGGEVITPNAMFLRMLPPPSHSGADAWKGNFDSWDRLFHLAETRLVFKAR